MLTAIDRLARFAAGIRLEDAPREIREAVRKSVFDSLAVGLCGAATPEIESLVAAWPLAGGDARVWGTVKTGDVAGATLLNGAALCSLELDEGNKFARGHPGAHVLPAALAEAQRIGASGRRLLDAYLAGYEVAARFARAFSPAAGLHPHGNWGAMGAAVAVARLNGGDTDGDARALAEAIDAAGGLALASPFSSALTGSFVRNMWVGTAGVNGLTAARLVAAGLGTVDATPAETFGRLLGKIDAGALVEELGERFEIVGGYYKRHSSCNYTHPPADAALLLFAQGVRIADVERVTVTTHRLALPLDNPAPRTRLAAMFSIPHVIAVALRDGKVEPAGFSPAALADPDLDQARRRVVVRGDATIDARLPHERVACVEVELRDGRTVAAEVPNAVGDAAHHPFSFDGLVAKAAALLGADRARALAAAVEALPLASDLCALDACLSRPLAADAGDRP